MIAVQQQSGEEVHRKRSVIPSHAHARGSPERDRTTCRQTKPPAYYRHNDDQETRCAMGSPQQCRLGSSWPSSGYCTRHERCVIAFTHRDTARGQMTMPRRQHHRPIYHPARSSQNRLAKVSSRDASVQVVHPCSRPSTCRQSANPRRRSTTDRLEQMRRMRDVSTSQGDVA